MDILNGKTYTTEEIVEMIDQGEHFDKILISMKKR
jgi:uncharacterized protein (DUF433 family)